MSMTKSAYSIDLLSIQYWVEYLRALREPRACAAGTFHGAQGIARPGNHAAAAIEG
jgi:hypothetical protein